MRCARAACSLEAGLDRIGDEDRRGAGDPSALHHELADTAGADHEHGRAGGDLRRVEGGADAGEGGAAQQRSLVERDGAPKRQRDLLGDDDPVGEAAGSGAAVDGLSSVRHPCCLIRQRTVDDRCVERPAGRGTTATASGARAARRCPGQHDVVARLHERHRVAHRLDGPGALVAEHHRRRALELALHLVEVGAADPDGRHPDDDLVRARLVQVELDDLERLADSVEERGAGLHLSGLVSGAR